MEAQILEIADSILWLDPGQQQLLIQIGPRLKIPKVNLFSLHELVTHLFFSDMMQTIMFQDSHLGKAWGIKSLYYFL